MPAIAAKNQNLNIILRALKDGKVLVFPTDTVYGLVCDAANPKAVNKIFKIKKRSKSKPLAVFVKDIQAAKKLAFINRQQEAVLKESRITAIFKARGKKLSPLTYKKGTIGLRIPNYGLLKIILGKFKKPLAQTSANISGKSAPTKIEEVLKQFKSMASQPDLIINAGDLPKNKPSKVIDLTKNKILRE